MSSSRICRICIKENSNLRIIDGTKVPYMIEKCSKVKIRKEDELPNRICTTCFRMLIKCYTFTTKIERNDYILRKYLNCKSSLKTKYDTLNIEPLEANVDSIKSANNNNNVFEIKNVDISEIENKTNTVQFLFDSPPPLVPLKPIMRMQVDENITQPKLYSIPKDAPPLVPIKSVTKVDIVKMQYRCKTCNDEFSSVIELKDHQSTTTACRRDLLKCNICQEKFLNSRRLIGHLKGHLVKKTYVCEICGKSYPNWSTFTIHKRTHTGERPFKCSLCPKTFARRAELLRHMRGHGSEKSYECVTCGRSFKNSSNLTRHKFRHTMAQPYSCSYCNKTFNQSDNLQVHIKMNHLNEKSFLCSTCGKSFVNLTRLNRHMWIHSDSKPYSCTTCQKEYVNLIDLKNHENRVHSGRSGDELKKYKCDMCNMRFFHPCRLAKHKKCHGNSYDCKVCGRSYCGRKNLIKHMQHKHRVKCVVESDNNFKFQIEYTGTEDEISSEINDYVWRKVSIDEAREHVVL